jgi:predicted S18 family serine protease
MSVFFREVDFMKKRFMIFALVLTCILACCKTAYALTPAPRIEGTIFLPEGKVAPPGGIKLKVIAEASNSVRTFESMINEGENSTNYWLTVFTMSGGLEIRCELVTPVEGYYEVSYYTGNTQKPFKAML